MARVAEWTETYTAAGWQAGGAACVVPAQPQVTPDLVRQTVSRLVPAVPVGVAPPTGGITLVNSQTIFWVASARSRPLTLPPLLGHKVTVTLTFHDARWSFGDGVSEDVTSPGKAYDPAGDPCRTALCPDYYGHVYSVRGTVSASVTVTWTATFSLDGGAPIPIPGTVTGPAATSQVRVVEARSVLVTDPPHR